MDESTLGMLSSCPDARSRWVHDLRNAVNAMGTGVALSQRLIEKGRAEEALAILRDGAKAMERCQALLAHADAATDLPGPEGLETRDAPARR